MLTDDKIIAVLKSMQGGKAGFRVYWGYVTFARAIEAEVRKDDEALIRQMRNALYALPLPYTSETRAALQAANEWLDAAIATRASLEKAP